MSSRWYTHLLDKVEIDGPIQMYVSEEEYSELRAFIRRCWVGDTTWSNRTHRLLLAFFRGYTFYRELSENEDQFWASFCSELGLDPKPPTLRQYDEVWKAFNSHSDVANLCIKSRRREFVKTIDAVWSIYGLRSKQLERMFLAYYRSYAEEPVTAELISKIEPSATLSVIHQAGSYDRVFRSLVHVVDYILGHRILPEQLSPHELTSVVEQSGLGLGHPNPIRFLYNKSPHILPDIIAALSNQPRWREQRGRQKKAHGRLSALGVRKDR